MKKEPQILTWIEPNYKIMLTSSNGNIFRVTGHLCGEFTGPGEFPTQRPVTRSFDVFFDLRLSKRLSKQWWGWWFETISCSLWRHRNGWWVSYICRSSLIREISLLRQKSLPGNSVENTPYVKNRGQNSVQVKVFTSWAYTSVEKFWI